MSLLVVFCFIAEFCFQPGNGSRSRWNHSWLLNPPWRHQTSWCDAFLSPHFPAQIVMCFPHPRCLFRVAQQRERMGSDRCRFGRSSSYYSLCVVETLFVFPWKRKSLPLGIGNRSLDQPKTVDRFKNSVEIQSIPIQMLWLACSVPGIPRSIHL